MLTVGSQTWWGRLAGPVDAETPLEQGKFDIEGADPIRTLDAIVALGHDMGFIALGRAKRERVQAQAHDQVIAVGFDRTGQPTWTRLLDHFRAMHRIDSGPFGPRLTQLRERRGWSREQLAESSGLAVDTIEQIERDQFSPPLADLRRLASAFGLRLSELFQDP